MNVRISIKTYKRKEMLISLLKEIDVFKQNSPSFNISVSIIDDCSDYPKTFISELKKSYSYFSPKENKGKRKHWELWNFDLEQCAFCKETDLFIFIPDDVSNIDFYRIIKLWYEQEDYFVFNIINDGRKVCWNNYGPRPVNEEYFKQFFTDCAFFTDYRSLCRLGFFISDVGEKRFKYDETLSSGVGQQLTQRLIKSKISIFNSYNSLAYHGDHDSVMHYNERKKKPLLAILETENKEKPVYIGIATFKGREECLKKTIESLENQSLKPKHIFVYNNEDNVDLTDNGKFYGLTQIKEDCIYLSCDDDLIYYKDYIKDMVQAIDKYKCIVSHHGRKLLGLNRNYYRGHKVYYCLHKNETETEIDVAGTGVTGFDTSYFNPKELVFSKLHRMSDCIFSLLAAENNKKIMVLKHNVKDFIQQEIELETSCHYTQSRSCDEQNRIANKIVTLKYRK